jgi:hypothetical protein
MAYNLFLDDIRMPYQVGDYIRPISLRSMYRLKQWEIVRNYDEFVSIIFEKGIPSIVSFDHDLAEIHYDPSTWTEGFKYHEKTGLDCAKYLIQICQDFKVDWLPEWYVHSMNPVGGENIKNYINSYEKTYRIFPSEFL